MRNITRRSRIRRARRTRRRVQHGGGCYDMKGGIPILNTETIAQWLRKVFVQYRAYTDLTDADPRKDYNFSIFDDMDIAYDADKQYILPVDLRCVGDKLEGVLAEDPAQKELYDLRGNYGRVIFDRVQGLLQQPTFRSFSTTVASASAEEAEEGAILPLLEIENTLRAILRAVLPADEIERNAAIADNIRNLSNVTSYPLYIWAIARNVGVLKAKEEASVVEDMRPILIPAEKVREMTETPTPAAGPARPTV